MKEVKPRIDMMDDTERNEMRERRRGVRSGIVVSK